jgi:hypothetical protein
VYPDPANPTTPKPLSYAHLPSSGGNYEDVFSELMTLRKKYDAIVEYTVHVTAERDTCVAELEAVKKGSGRDAKKPLGLSPSPARARSDMPTESKVQQVFFSISLISLLLFLTLSLCMH